MKQSTALKIACDDMLEKATNEIMKPKTEETLRSYHIYIEAYNTLEAIRMGLDEEEAWLSTQSVSQPQ